MRREEVQKGIAHRGYSRAAPGPDGSGPRVRFVSYNIHGCIGRDRRLNPGRIVSVLSEIPADVVALQEVPSAADHGREFLELAGSATGLMPVPGPLFDHPHTHYANALLSRLPVQAVRHLDLTVRGCSPRGGIDADLECGDAKLRVIATHLGLRPRERRHQIERLLRLVGQGKGHPVVLLGDINEWLAWGRPLRWLHAHFRKPPALRSFPSGLPLFALDRIWVSCPGRVASFQTHSTRLARAASDHLPIVATVDLRLWGPQLVR